MTTPFAKDQEIAGLREALTRAEEQTRQAGARLVHEMLDQWPWKDRAEARVALSIAASAVARGRHLTEQEKIANLGAAFGDHG